MAKGDFWRGEQRVGDDVIALLYCSIAEQQCNHHHHRKQVQSRFPTDNTAEGTTQHVRSQVLLKYRETQKQSVKNSVSKSDHFIDLSVYRSFPKIELQPDVYVDFLRALEANHRQ
jgi:hypothetical protein